MTPPMQTHRMSQPAFIFFTALGLLLIYLLAPIFTPFLLGALFAYLCDPLVKRLQKLRVPHILSVIIVFFALFCLVLLFILMLVPIIQSQLELLLDNLPQMIAWLQDELVPWIKEYVTLDTLKSTVPSSLSKGSTWVFNTVVKSGHTVVEFVVNLVLTPVVTFYLLRDWDSVRKALVAIIPSAKQATVIKLARECDEVLSAFFRGQLLVMLALCFIYSTGLTLIGLNLGLVIGLIGGLLSIVPYLGSIFVVVVASIAALIQFGDWHSLLWVLGVFLLGQGLEGYVLSPYLIGGRIGLHPVAVIFAIMAGGALFGFFGVLVALPAAAVIKVLLKFAGKKYYAEA
jgi:predicted PurR-regulated permease PerM